MSTRTLSSEDTAWLSRFLVGNENDEGGDDGKVVVPVIAVKKKPSSAANSPNDLVYHAINSDDEDGPGPGGIRGPSPYHYNQYPQHYGHHQQQQQQQQQQQHQYHHQYQYQLKNDEEDNDDKDSDSDLNDGHDADDDDTRDDTRQQSSPWKSINDNLRSTKKLRDHKADSSGSDETWHTVEKKTPSPPQKSDGSVPQSAAAAHQKSTGGSTPPVTNSAANTPAGKKTPPSGSSLQPSRPPRRESAAAAAASQDKDQTEQDRLAQHMSSAIMTTMSSMVMSMMSSSGTSSLVATSVSDTTDSSSSQSRSSTIRTSPSSVEETITILSGGPSSSSTSSASTSTSTSTSSSSPSSSSSSSPTTTSDKTSTSSSSSSPSSSSSSTSSSSPTSTSSPSPSGSSPTTPSPSSSSSPTSPSPTSSSTSSSIKSRLRRKKGASVAPAPNYSSSSNSTKMTPPPIDEGGFQMFLKQMQTIKSSQQLFANFLPKETAENAKPSTGEPISPDQYYRDEAGSILWKSSGSLTSKLSTSLKHALGVDSNEDDVIDEVDVEEGQEQQQQAAAAGGHFPSNPTINTTNPDGVQEIPLSYSPSSYLRPWGNQNGEPAPSKSPNVFLSAIPEENKSDTSVSNKSIHRLYPPLLTSRRRKSIGSAASSTKARLYPWSWKEKVCFVASVVCTFCLAGVALWLIVTSLNKTNSLSRNSNEDDGRDSRFQVILEPTSVPSLTPSVFPTGMPSLRPTVSMIPSTRPTRTSAPSFSPTTPLPSTSFKPSGVPTLFPTISFEPTTSPSVTPSKSLSPTTGMPSSSPIIVLRPSRSSAPSLAPTAAPSTRAQRSSRPSFIPSISESPTRTPAMFGPTMDLTPSNPTPFFPSSSAPTGPEIFPSPTIDSGPSSSTTSNQPFMSIPTRSVQPTSNSVPTTSAPVAGGPGTVGDTSMPSQAPTIDTTPQPTPEPTLPPTPQPTPAPIPLGPGIDDTGIPSPEPSIEPTFRQGVPTLSSLPTFTASPTDDLFDGIRWERFGEVSPSMSPFRAVSMSGLGDRVAVAEIDRLQVFQFNDQTEVWGLLGSTIPLASAVSLQLSRDGNTLVYGSFERDPVNGKRSFVTLLRFDGTDWVPLGQRLPGTCGFVNSVAVSDNGSIVAVGDPFDNHNTGLVTVFGYNESGDRWDQMGDTIKGFASGDYAGAAVSLSGNGTIVATGSPGSSITILNGGVVKVCKYDTTTSTWNRLGQVLRGQFRQKQFGYSVSLSQDGSRVAVGAPFFEPFGIGEGTVFVYELQAAQQNLPNDLGLESQLLQQQQQQQQSPTLLLWSQLGNVISGSHFADSAGMSVSLSASGQTVALGAPGRDYLQVLALTTMEDLEQWREVGFLKDSSIDNFGVTVSLADTGRIVAAGGASSGALGNTQMFSRTDSNPI